MAAARTALTCDERTCTRCGRTKHRNLFAGKEACNRCRKVGPKVLTRALPGITLAVLASRCAPSPAELRAVEECARLIVASARGMHASVGEFTFPEAVIDAAVGHWKRRIQLGSLAIAMCRERVG